MLEGPAGYTAAIYASRADLKPILYQGNQPGGQLTITTEVDNFPGYPNGVNGPEMMEDLKKQAERFGTDVRWGTIEAVDFSHHPFQCKADDGKTIEAETVIVATELRPNGWVFQANRNIWELGFRVAPLAMVISIAVK